MIEGSLVKAQGLLIVQAQVTGYNNVVLWRVTQDVDVELRLR